MAITRDWRPDNWDRIKENIMTETPIVFSPSTGYPKDQIYLFMEKAVSAALAALVEVIVTE